MFEQAHGGTLFLDELGELPIDLQPKLLRVLETREVRPIGATGAPKRIDVRIIAATNRRLSEAVHANEFRRDLFYRLAVARVTIPPLRDRREDIPPIAKMFLERALAGAPATLPHDLGALLQAHDWPGNVRELRNVVERYALLGARDARELFDGTKPSPGRPPMASLPYHEARRRALDVFERDYVQDIIKQADGVIVRAAEMAGVSRPTFYRMLQRVRGPDDDDTFDGS
jgi:DNA-binding NtrC family response regulator